MEILNKIDIFLQEKRLYDINGNEVLVGDTVSVNFPGAKTRKAKVKKIKGNLVILSMKVGKTKNVEDMNFKMNNINKYIEKT